MRTAPQLDAQRRACCRTARRSCSCGRRSRARTACGSSSRAEPRPKPRTRSTCSASSSSSTASTRSAPSAWRRCCTCRRSRSSKDRSTADAKRSNAAWNRARRQPRRLLHRQRAELPERGPKYAAIPPGTARIEPGLGYSLSYRAGEGLWRGPRAALEVRAPGGWGGRAELTGALPHGAVRRRGARVPRCGADARAGVALSGVAPERRWLRGAEPRVGALHTCARLRRRRAPGEAAFDIAARCQRRRALLGREWTAHRPRAPKPAWRSYAMNTNSKPIAAANGSVVPRGSRRARVSR